MAALYQLEIVTPMGRKFRPVDNCVFRSTEGDVGILKGHSPYVAAIETGETRSIPRMVRPVTQQHRKALSM